MLFKERYVKKKKVLIKLPIKIYINLYDGEEVESNNDLNSPPSNPVTEHSYARMETGLTGQGRVDAEDESLRGRSENQVGRVGNDV